MNAAQPSRDGAVADPTRRPGYRRQRVGIVVAAGLVIVVSWAIAAASSVSSAADRLEAAREHVIVAEQAVRDGALDRAGTELELAAVASGDAARILSGSHLAVLQRLPWAGPNLRAASNLSIVATEVTEAASELAQALASLEADRDEAIDAALPVDLLVGLDAPARAFAVALSRGYRDLVGLDPEGLHPRLVAARGQFLDLADRHLEQATLAADLVEVLPILLGIDEDRRYLVGAASLSELRGSGGLLGSWSVLTVREGQLTFEEFIGVDDLPSFDGTVAAPSPDFARRYAPFGALDSWRNANMSPDFPAVGDLLLRRYEAAGGPEVDGLILADTLVFSRLAERAGGLEVPGIGRLDPAAALRLIGLEAYDLFDDDDQRKRVLGSVAIDTLGTLFDVADDDLRGTLRFFSDLVSDGHLKVYVVDGQIQGILERARMAGSLPNDTAESVGVYVNNFGENKVDFFVDRRIEHVVRLGEGGVTVADVEVVFGSRAPTEGFGLAVLGPLFEGLSSGDGRYLVTFSCGPRCEVEARPPAARDGGLERGRTMIDQPLIVAAGELEHLRFATRTPQGWLEDEGRRHVRVQHLVQPTVSPTDLRLRVEIPEGFEVAEPGDGRIEGDAVVWQGMASGLVELEVVFAPSTNMVSDSS